jgi:hypothetical protein
MKKQLAIWSLAALMLFFASGCSGTVIVNIGGNVDVTLQNNNVGSDVLDTIGLTNPLGQECQGEKPSGANSGTASGSRWQALFNQVIGYKKATPTTTNETDLSATGL